MSYFPLVLLFNWIGHTSSQQATYSWEFKNSFISSFYTFSKLVRKIFSGWPYYSLHLIFPFSSVKYYFWFCGMPFILLVASWWVYLLWDSNLMTYIFLVSFQVKNVCLYIIETLLEVEILKNKCHIVDFRLFFSSSFIKTVSFM